LINFAEEVSPLAEKNTCLIILIAYGTQYNNIQDLPLTQRDNVTTRCSMLLGPAWPIDSSVPDNYLKYGND
jgi:hypothetical protein